MQQHTSTRTSPPVDIAWSASPMGTRSGEDLQLVEGIAISGCGIARAVYMVDIDTGEVLAQNTFAALLLNPGAGGESLHETP